MRLFALFAFLCLIALPLRAEDVVQTKGEYAEVTLHLGEWKGDVLHGAVEFSLKEGWKTYWRSPGDGGVPLTLELLPETAGVEEVKQIWPAPTRFVEEWGLEVFGFKNHLLLPVEFHVQTGIDAAHIVLQGNYSVCKDICITEDFRFETDVKQADSAASPRVTEAFALGEKPLEEGKWTVAEASISNEDAGAGELFLSFTKAGKYGKVEDVFVESDQAGLRFPKGQKRYSGNGVEFTLPYEVSVPATTALGKTVTVTLVEDGRPYHSTITLPAAVVSHEQPATTPLSLHVMLWLAFAGGLILNIMPCVLPVVSLKLVHILKKHGAHKRQVRASLFSTASGVLVFFMGFAALVSMLRVSGETLGWGFHFQSPLFLSLLTVIIWVFAGNLLGLFEFRLPQVVVDAEGKAVAHSGGLQRDFLTGAFAALMATPCTAPFLGTAVAFALTQGVAEIFAIFLALGLGLAFPLLLMGCIPAWTRLLPRPGLWMVRVKQVMGGLLVVCGLWFLWVIALQKDAAVAGMVLLTAISILVFLHVKDRSVHTARVGVFVAALLVMMVVNITTPARLAAVEPDEGWTMFTEDALRKSVAEGEVVFVDMTAAWCLNCKFNKLRVLDREETLQFFHDEDVVLMRGDLTRPNEAFEAFVKAHGRAGIPFNVVYGPHARKGIVLSEVLTLDELRTAVLKAKAKDKTP